MKGLRRIFVDGAVWKYSVNKTHVTIFNVSSGKRTAVRLSAVLSVSELDVRVGRAKECATKGTLAVRPKMIREYIYTKSESL